MHKIKWGIIGLGNIAHQFASQFQDENAELTGVASRTLQKAYDFSSRYNVKKAYGTYEELVYDPEIDIIYIATPNHSHYKHILMALNAGKHVFCEKPITLNKQQLDAVITLAKSKQLLVAEAMAIFYMPLYKELKKQISTGKYGKLTMIHVEIGSGKIYEPNKRFFNPDLGGGALFDIGVYAFYFIRYFLSSQPHERQTTVSISDTGVDEKSGFLFKNPQNEIATASINILADMPVRATLTFDNAIITVYDFPRATQAVITYSDGKKEELNRGDSSKTLTYEIETITRTLLSEDDFTSLSLTQDVNELIEWAAKEWKMNWVFNNFNE